MLADPEIRDDRPIRRASLSEQVADRIRDMIIEGHLAPGQKINEAQLVDELGVSRTPMREALHTLAAENLVDLRPSRGALVRKLSAADVHSMLEVLAELEGLAGRLVCERGSDEAIAALLILHDEMMDLYRKSDRLPYYKANQAFHSGIAEASRNRMLMEMQASIQSRLKRIRFVGNRSPERWSAAVLEHARMAQALRDRDGTALQAVMKEHLLKTWDRVSDVV